MNGDLNTSKNKRRYCDKVTWCSSTWLEVFLSLVTVCSLRLKQLKRFFYPLQYFYYLCIFHQQQLATQPNIFLKYLKTYFFLLSSLLIYVTRKCFRNIPLKFIFDSFIVILKTKSKLLLVIQWYMYIKNLIKKTFI